MGKKVEESLESKVYFNEESLCKFIEAANRTVVGKGIDKKVDQLVLPNNYRYFKEIRIKSKLGSGRASRIPYIAFLGPEQEVQKGIYPAFLFYKAQRILILSFCISSTELPIYTWDSYLPPKVKTIGDYKDILGLDKTEWNYNNSYVAKIWKVEFDSKGKVINSTSSVDKDTVIYPFNNKDAISTFWKIYNDNYDNFLWRNGLVEEAKESKGKETIFRHDITSGIDEASIEKENHNSEFDLNKVIDVINSTNLLYDKELIRRYACSLMTKPFVILSGLAGSGKTQLALVFAHALSENVEKQVCFVAVGADWTNREPLFGYANALNRNEYVKPENGVLDIILRAKADPSHPYFLILDEMNLSYVERYFADFLSAMESHKPILLWNNNSLEVPSQIDLPSNLFIIGTINVDETTYMFSPKVLDRASVLEFKISSVEMKEFLSRMKPADIKKADGECSSMSENFVKASLNKEFESDHSIDKILLDFFKSLKDVNAEFGYRSASEIYRYIYNHNSHPFQNETAEERMDRAVDAAIIQKLLPKLHGSRKRVVPVLKKLWIICYQPHIAEPTPLDEYKETIDSGSQFRYPISADKILRMFNAALDNGFMSFAEA